jgi:hypothetical protein
VLQPLSVYMHEARTYDTATTTTTTTAINREQLLASARECFAGRAADWIRDGGVASYMTRVEVRITSHNVK